MSLVFAFKKPEKNVRVGESIAVNGVCLTATRITSKKFSADLVQETLSASHLGNLKVGDQVNLERSLKAGDSVGGHWIAGHVDGVGHISEIKERGKNWSLLVSAPQNIISKLVLKGSIACDGVSLTVQKIERQRFGVAVIPHTLHATTLGFKKEGDVLNLEIDVLTRYMKSNASRLNTKKFTVRQLQRQGF